MRQPSSAAVRASTNEQAKRKECVSGQARAREVDRKRRFACPRAFLHGLSVCATRDCACQAQNQRVSQPSRARTAGSWPSMSAPSSIATR
eukprot:4558624-Pleurochrysis_carterae.AAC.1